MNNQNFFVQYLMNPRIVGAISPSSKYLSAKMVENIKFNQVQCIVEYGSGTGVITKEILKRRNPNTTVLLFEKNQEFYQLLNKKFASEKNVIIINDSAENLGDYLDEFNIPYVDSVISGLPFASIPRQTAEEILENTLNYLKSDGEFVTFQYTKCKMNLFNQFFPHITIQKEMRNIPPAYILYCKKTEIVNRNNMLVHNH